MLKSEESEIYSFMEKLGWPFRQINGQRILGPKKGNPAPEPGSEIMIKHIPSDFFENKLYPTCAKYGEIYSLRILVNFTGETRGVAFVRYSSVDSANLAVQKLNRYRITSSNTLSVMKSLDNVKLYVGGIPATTSEEELLEKFNKAVDGVVCVKFGPVKASNRSNSRRYAFVEFRCHREAALARRYFRENFSMWQTTIVVDWAKPEVFPNLDYITNNKRIFIRNLAPNISVGTIVRVILTRMSTEYIERVYVKSGYGFIHLTSHNAAKFLLKNLKDMVIADLPIHMEWARPSSIDEILLSNYKSIPYEMLMERRRRRHQFPSINA